MESEHNVQVCADSAKSSVQALTHKATLPSTRYGGKLIRKGKAVGALKTFVTPPSLKSTPQDPPRPALLTLPDQQKIEKDHISAQK